LDFRFASIQSQKSRKVVPKWFMGFLATGTEKAVVEIPLIVLAIDIVGYTKHLFALGEQGRKEYHDRIRAALGSLVSDHGAEKLSDRGDGGLFAWDLPESSSDKREAIHKAILAIRELLKISEIETDLSFRIGISAGSVRCEWREGEISYLGDSLNIASRLEGMAKPGRALLDSSLLGFVDEEFLDVELIAEERKGIVYKARSLKSAA
jgi:class 3 adenylate cyclase